MTIKRTNVVMMTLLIGETMLRMLKFWGPGPCSWPGDRWWFGPFSRHCTGQIVLEECLGIAGFCLDRDVIGIVQRPGVCQCHIGRRRIDSTICIAPAGEEDAVCTVVTDVPVAIVNRDRVAQPDSAERGLKLILLPDRGSACNWFSDDHFTRIILPDISTGDHLHVERCDKLHAIERDRP